jgi:hypothetical protein
MSCPYACLELLSNHKLVHKRLHYIYIYLVVSYKCHAIIIPVNPPPLCGSLPHGLVFRQRGSSKWGNFQKYWLQNVGQDFIVLDFFHVWKIFVGGRSCGRLMSTAQETQSMRETPAQRGRVNRYDNGMTFIWNY